MKISKHQNFRDEYCATICRIGEIFPIEGKDRIVKTLVNGLSIVIGKEEFKTGDVAVYCANETVLHELFLHLNSMYDDPELNLDKTKRGYINKHGRIRIIKLGGVVSSGLLLNPKTIADFVNEPVDKVVKFMESHVGEDFDELNGERFVHVYVPPVRVKENISRGEKKQAKLKRFKMLIDGSFRFHYDTGQFAKEIHNFNPDEKLYISTKIHGTSLIASNITTNIPTNWFKRMWRKLTHKYEYDQSYNLIYSSRSVVKNDFINPKQKDGGYYSDDIWGYWAEKLKGLIPEDYAVYGEIVGFTPNGSAIQKEYDYGCSPNDEEKSKLMIYRVTINDKECEIPEVIKFGEMLKEKLGDLIIPFPLLYEGTLKELHPDVVVDDNWHENVLEKMKNEKRFLMEQNEPMCNNKVPREGVVIRKADDQIKEAWKLKCDKFRLREAKEMDAGNVDIEMEEGYGTESE